MSCLPRVPCRGFRIISFRMPFSKQFVIACGGTGGHLFPGLAVAETLHKRGHEVLLLVSEKEIDTVALRGHPEFRTEKLPSVGMPSVLSPAFPRFLKRGWESFSTCRQLYGRYLPSAVLGMGGFTSAAPILAARVMGIPSFLHESNAIAGRANRLAARWTDKVLIGLNACESSFPSRTCIVTGTPVRRDLGTPLPKADARAAFGLDPDKLTILVMGGSQGAAGINQLLFRAAPFLRERNLQVIHLTGDRDDNLAAINYQREGLSAHVMPFHHRMAEAYSAADLVISRAGAASLSEISQFSLPSVLIPFPFASECHQHRNAEAFRDAGAAEVLEEKNIDPESLALLVTNLLADERRRERMSAAAATVLPRGSSGLVADVLEEAVR
jgi:UDP-N-acetylglucosamine--N-acetylmuramyl-(pentapeptide) pyrophosphoryl-undecaprenol N-acetylglucosamine transferase